MTEGIFYCWNNVGSLLSLLAQVYIWGFSPSSIEDFAAPDLSRSTSTAGKKRAIFASLLESAALKKPSPRFLTSRRPDQHKRPSGERLPQTNLLWILHIFGVNSTILRGRSRRSHYPKQWFKLNSSKRCDLLISYFQTSELLELKLRERVTPGIARLLP